MKTRTRRKTRIKRKTITRRKREKRGGKIIGSGGFGCIFKPALKCENSIKPSPNNISKLMTKKNATDEYQMIQRFKQVLKVIPNYTDYFLLNDFTLCKPDTLTKEDLINFDKCKPLNKKELTSKNINQSLNEVLSLNMPYGGVDVEDFIDNSFVSNTSQQFIQLNNSLIDLLTNGIGPMNKLNVFHCDIKDSNVLVQATEMIFTTKLIDWGLSIIQTNREIPPKLYRRPFQYNVPFSSILFNKDFLTKYNEFLRINKTPDYFQIREFVINYIFIWNEIRGSGHLSTIHNIVKKLTIKELPEIKDEKIKNHFVEYDFTYYYIVEYLSKILEKFTKNGQIDILTYFNTVFLKNIDIWGFVMVYIPLYEYMYQKNEALVKQIKYIIIHFLYETPTDPINVDLLVNELTKLNGLFGPNGYKKREL